MYAACATSEDPSRDNSGDGNHIWVSDFHSYPQPEQLYVQTEGFEMLMKRLSFAHLIMGLLRCRVILRSEFWKRPWNLSLPNGQLTLEFSLKLFQEPQKPREVGDETV